MSHRARIRLLAAAATAALPVLTYTASAAAASPVSAAHSAVRACAAPTAGHAACNAWVRTTAVAAKVSPNATPSGYGPSDLQSAYNLPSATSGSGQTVAIVDAYDDPTTEADLAVYRAQFGLPACTTANGCFKKVNQSGGTSYPRKNGGWARRSPSTWTWSPRSAPTATSCWSRPPVPPSRTWARPSTRRRA